VKLIGKLISARTAADNGGLRIAYMALMETLEGKAEAEDQRLYAGNACSGWSQIWCQVSTEEGARLRAATDPHSPGPWRSTAWSSTCLNSAGLRLPGGPADGA